jgi:succinate dehydrogenase hydrophobic anchor subunit
MATVTSNRSIEERAGRSGVAGGFWLVQAFSGLFLIALLGLHMIAHHFVVEGGLRDYQQVLDYVSNPVIFIIEVLFLIVVTSHAMLGLRAIVLDYGLSSQAQRVADRILTLVGVIALGYGIWLAVAIQGL